MDIIFTSADFDGAKLIDFLAVRLMRFRCDTQSRVVYIGM
jgi:hypothetical protein